MTRQFFTPLSFGVVRPAETTAPLLMFPRFTAKSELGQLLCLNAMFLRWRVFAPNRSRVVLLRRLPSGLTAKALTWTARIYGATVLKGSSCDE